MAVQPIDYLKEKFNNLKTPDGQDFSDLIDSCHNLAVSALSAGFVLSVNGSVSAGDYVYDKNGNSSEWNSVYSNVQSNSASRDSSYTTVNTNSATNWNYQGTDLKDLSSNWEDTYTLFAEQSANNVSVYTVVNTNSASWDYQGLDIKSLSADWVGGNDAYTNLVSNSAAYLSGVDLSFLSVSANWDSVYTVVNTNSASWDAAFASAGVDALVRSLTGDWVGGNDAYTNLVSNSAAYLSGVDLSFLSVSANWDSSYTTVNSNSGNWDYQGLDIKSLSADWIGGNSAYTTVNTNSATTWNYQGTDLKGLSSGWVGGNSAYTNLVSNSAAYLSGADLSFLSVSANWNSAYTTINDQSANNVSVYTTVNANSASYATISFTNNKFLPLTGGNITGKTYFYDNLTVYGNVSATGNSYFTNTVYSTTSALSVINIGNTGPAIYVGNNGSGDIASFYDIDQNIEILHVGGNNSLYPNVGIKVSNPNKDFTVKGELSASGIIWDSNGNSNHWNSVYTNVNTNSATTWNYQGTDLKGLSSGWVGGNSAYTNLVSNSAAYLSGADLSFLSVSANWNSVYTNVNTNSATTWNYQGTDLKGLSSGWVGGNSAYTNVNSNSANWNSVYTNVGSNSASYATISFANNKFLPLSGGTISGNLTITGNLSTLGSVTQIDTQVFVTSAVSVTNAGTGPALTVKQTGAQDIATFFDDSNTALIIKDGGNVGIGTSTPNEALTVVGNISATGNFVSSNNHYLADNGTAIGLTRTGYFGNALTLLANKVYELEYHLYFKNNNTSATTVVNYALSGNKQFSNVNANFMQDEHVLANAVSTRTTVGSVGPVVDLGDTEMLTASISAYGVVRSIVAVGAANTSVSIALSCNNSSGVTPLKGSYRKITQFN